MVADGVAHKSSMIPLATLQNSHPPQILRYDMKHKKKKMKEATSFDVKQISTGLETMDEQQSQDRQLQDDLFLESLPDEWISILPSYMQCRVGDLAGCTGGDFRVSVSPEIADRIRVNSTYRYCTEYAENLYFIEVDPNNIENAIGQVADLWLSDAEENGCSSECYPSYIVLDVAVNIGTGEISIELDY